jgi:putative ATPase
MFDSNRPLAERLRPKSLNDYIGQDHLVGSDAPLRKMIESGVVPSLIFWGPPGTGKTTLAEILAESLKRPFFKLSAVNSGVKDIREVIEKASGQSLFSQQRPVLFIDEIHRFSKSQQDSLLHAVEKGSITLIGATTENPSFEVISALLSRCQVYVLKPFTKEWLQEILDRAISTDPELSKKKITIEDGNALFRFAGGDARKMLNILEMMNMHSASGFIINETSVAQIVKTNPTLYDKDGEQHYDIISAFIKSIRGSDPNAAVYWLARMIEGGEDPKFIARRMIILASEDIGNANPTALVIALNTFQAVQVIGMPESRIILSQCATYLACSSKSNAAYKAINEAQNAVRESGNLPVPLQLRNAPTALMQELGYGDNYQYAHDYQGNFVPSKFMPDELLGSIFYNPGNNARENEMRIKLKNWWKDIYNY